MTGWFRNTSAARAPGPKPGDLRVGPFVGFWDSPTGTPLYYEGDGHLLLCAPARSGKARDVIVASLLTNRSSAFVIDVKGELTAVTMRARQEMGHEVYILNPFGEPEETVQARGWPSHGFNPLMPINPQRPNFISDVEGLASALIVQDGKGEPHWSDSARSLVGGLMLHEILDKKAKGEAPQLATVRAYLTISESEFQIAIQAMAQHPHPVVRDRLATFGDTMTNELRAVRSSAKTQTTWLSDDGMQRVTSGHDFDFADMKHRPITVFVILPSRHVSGGSSYSRYLRMLVQSAIDAMAAAPKTRKESVWFCIDEFYSLGHMAIVERMSSEGAGYGIQLQPIIQNLGQLKELYPQNWETFIGNAAIRQFFAPQDLTTAKYLSEFLGQWTANTQSINADGRVSSGETGRPLLRHEEVMQLASTQQIVFARGSPRPLLLYRAPYYAEHWGLAGRYDANPYFVA